MTTLRCWLTRWVDEVVSTVASARLGLRDPIALVGISVQIWRLYGLFWLVSLAYASALALAAPLTLLRLLLVLACLGIFAAVYVWFIWPHPGERLARSHAPSRQALGWFALLVALVLALSLFDRPTWLWLFVCVAAVAGAIFPLRTAAVVIVLLTACCLVLGVLRLGWMQAIPLALLVRGLGLDVIGLILLMGLLRQMRRQQRMLAQLAVTEERLRLARDLHDVLGRNLSVVTLKSALAERLIAVDPDRALEEMRAVEETARATLREVRIAIAGVRQMTVASELEAARQLLEAAEIPPTIQGTIEALSLDVEGMLAAVIREGVTNVLRHSSATECQIVLGQKDQQVWAEITNDGCHQGTEMDRCGQGLAGLRERVEALGGRLVAGPKPLAGRPGFSLRADLSLRESSGKAPR
jgi:two-component system, NarL family, sensor histidine kinase DesK